MKNLLTNTDLNNINNLISKYDKNELEFRIGNFQEHMFRSSIDKNVYDKIMNNSILFQQNKVVFTKELVCKDLNNNQKIITYENGKQTNIYYRRKNRVQILDFQIFECRIALSNEIEIKSSQNNYNNCFRYKDRISKYSIDGNWRYDFTKVYTLYLQNSNIDNIQKNLENSKSNYEFEIEFIGQKLTLDLILNIFNFIIEYNLNNYKHLLKEIQSNLSDKIEFNYRIKKNPAYMIQFKKLTNPVITLSRENIETVLKNHAISEKADGENNFIYINKLGVFLINDRSVIKKIDIIVTDKSLYGTLLNGEYIHYLDCFLAFDCFIYKNIDISEKHLKYRYDCILNCEKNIISSANFRFYAKKYYFEKNIFKTCNLIYNNKYDYKIDGIIFTSINSGIRDIMYKWKPLNELTTDFLVKKVPNKEDLFYLYVTINKEDRLKYNIKIDQDHEIFFPMFNKFAYFVPIKFQFPGELKKTYIVKNKDLKDNTIVEFYYDNVWIPTRIRVDKTENYQKSVRIRKFFGPNAFIVAYDNWKNIHNDPITLDIITGKTPLKLARYFSGKKRRDSDITQMNYFHSGVVKEMLYEEYIGKCRKNNNVLELSGGRGGDIRKWIKHKIKYLTIIDFDKEALEEAKKRITNSNNIIKANYIHADLRTNVITKLSRHPYDSISMQFAIHYMLGNKVTLKNIFNNVNYKLKNGGYFIFTALDGELVFDLLSKNTIQYNESYDFMKNKKKIFGIKRFFKQNTFEELGQEISVFVETLGEHAGEFLVNFDYILNYFASRNYKLIKSEYFKDLLDKWDGKKNMSQPEIEFSSLYRYMVLQKI